MHVVCKKCSGKILVSHRPEGATTISGVQTTGNVTVAGGKIAFGPGGKVSFGSGGQIGFGRPKPSSFTCMSCGHTAEYGSTEIVD